MRADWLAGLLGVCLLGTAAAGGAMHPASDPDPASDGGQTRGVLEVEGVVQDGAGQPLSELVVILEAARGGGLGGTLGLARRDPQRVTTRSGTDGTFSLRWPHRRGYDHFQLLVGLSVRRAAGTHLEILARRDLSDRVRDLRRTRARSEPDERRAPLRVRLVVEDAAAVLETLAFLDDMTSPDERRVYEEMGKPDTVRRTDLAGHEEVTWWYFRRGRVYRFLDGELEAVQDFDPIVPF